MTNYIYKSEPGDGCVTREDYCALTEAQRDRLVGRLRWFHGTGCGVDLGDVRVIVVRPDVLGTGRHVVGHLSRRALRDEFVAVKTREDATVVLARMSFLCIETNDPPRLVRHVERAREFGAKWDWASAGAELRAAYAWFGVASCYEDDLSEGTAWHQGQHPIQLAGAAHADEE